MRARNIYRFYRDFVRRLFLIVLALFFVVVPARLPVYGFTTGNTLMVPSSAVQGAATAAAASRGVAGVGAAAAGNILTQLAASVATGAAALGVAGLIIHAGGVSDGTLPPQYAAMNQTPTKQSELKSWVTSTWCSSNPSSCNATNPIIWQLTIPYPPYTMKNPEHTNVTLSSTNNYGWRTIAQVSTAPTVCSIIDPSAYFYFGRRDQYNGFNGADSSLYIRPYSNSLLYLGASWNSVSTQYGTNVQPFGVTAVPTAQSCASVSSNYNLPTSGSRPLPDVELTSSQVLDTILADPQVAFEKGFEFSQLVDGSTFDVDSRPLTGFLYPGVPSIIPDGISLPQLAPGQQPYEQVDTYYVNPDTGWSPTIDSPDDDDYTSPFDCYWSGTCTDLNETDNSTDPYNQQYPTITPITPKQLETRNWLEYSINVFSNKFPFDIFTTPISATGSDVCPIYTFFDEEFELCFFVDIVRAIKLPAVLGFVIRFWDSI